MSREELEKRALEARYNLVSSKDKETIDILEELAIKALEQEPVLEQERILDKIRAEIEQDAFNDVNGSKYIFVNRVNQIIDKYRKGN